MVQNVILAFTHWHGCMQAEKRPPVLVYARPEDEFYHKHSKWSFTFPITNRLVAKDELQPLRLVMLLSTDEAAAARCVHRPRTKKSISLKLV